MSNTDESRMGRFDGLALVALPLVAMGMCVLAGANTILSAVEFASQTGPAFGRAVGAAFAPGAALFIAICAMAGWVPLVEKWRGRSR
ncbi:MAG: hypothetical protein ACQGVC_17145 [Myxococcota bacterium]